MINLFKYITCHHHEYFLLSLIYLLSVNEYEVGDYSSIFRQFSLWPELKNLNSDLIKKLCKI